ncbi:MAG: hypothetical protein C5B50_10330 [Verrucomicrobia bacterium]|nr:MAG: hypothetical protein C5B50_10330 [Verrucomicrobiota bacterium]
MLAGRLQLKPSANAYDWLGNGIYFWEHGPQRAREWAIEQARLASKKITEPTVLGAKIELRDCLDLLDIAHTRLLAEWYSNFRHSMQEKGIQLPQNRDTPGSRRGDRVLRFRDCAVIDFTLEGLARTQGIVYQTVRGVFVEGRPAFPGSKIALKSHIQIAVRDPACLAQVFRAEH